MTTPTLTTSQILYTFSFSAGSAGGIAFDNSSGGGMAALQSFVAEVERDVLQDTTIQGMIGDDWQIVWGPIAYSNDTTGPTVLADNAMGCYYSPSQSLIVIAIAGTNFASTFDWLDEDFDVRSAVSWTSVGGSGAGNLSAGSAKALQVLLAMADSQGTSMMNALAQFLSSNSITGATLAVTGHSLGGALAPVLGLYMADNQSSLGLGGQSLAVYASAGPTPGDSAFAGTYDAAIARNALAYSSVYNTLDIVPLAWAVSDLATIPTLYDANITPASTDSPPDAFMGSLISGVVVALAVAGIDYTQVSTGRTALTGTFDASVDKGISAIMNVLTSQLPSGLATYAESLTNVARFLAQAVTQHTTAYQTLLGITDFMTEFQTIVDDDKPSSATQREPTEAAVARLAGVDLAAARRWIAARSQPRAA